jgi:hypothetical protein
MRLTCLLLLAFWQIPANAELIFNGQPTGFSEIYNFNQNDPDLGFIIAGGLAGTSSPCPSGSGTCDNCTGNWISDNRVCNRTRVTPNTELVLSFSSTSKFGTPILTTSIGNNEQAVTTNSPVPTTAPNQGTTLRISWGSICAALDSSFPTCEGLIANRSFKVGIDGGSPDGQLDGSDDDLIPFTIHVVAPNGTAFATPTPAYNNSNFATCASGGFCNFTLSKGDEKAYLSDIQVSSTGLAGITYKHVWFFCAEGTDFSAINSICVNDRVAISGNGLADDVIDGLGNGKDYVFRAATVDIAGNIGLFLNIDTSRQQVTPDDVVGLFDENSCFVATAAYGSPLEKNVKVLRAFRDKVLLKTSVGQLFVKAYYFLSPPLAKWIGLSATRRSVARTVLTPLVLLTTFLMEQPFLFCFFVLFLMSGILFWLRQRREQLT